MTGNAVHCCIQTTCMSVHIIKSSRHMGRHWGDSQIQNGISTVDDCYLFSSRPWSWASASGKDPERWDPMRIPTMPYGGWGRDCRTEGLKGYGSSGRRIFKNSQTRDNDNWMQASLTWQVPAKKWSVTRWQRRGPSHVAYGDSGDQKQLWQVVLNLADEWERGRIQ